MYFFPSYRKKNSYFFIVIFLLYRGAVLYLWTNCTNSRPPLYITKVGGTLCFAELEHCRVICRAALGWLFSIFHLQLFLDLFVHKSNRPSVFPYCDYLLCGNNFFSYKILVIGIVSVWWVKKTKLWEIQWFMEDQGKVWRTEGSSNPGLNVISPTKVLLVQELQGLVPHGCWCWISHEAKCLWPIQK